MGAKRQACAGDCGIDSRQKVLNANESEKYGRRQPTSVKVVTSVKSVLKSGKSVRVSDGFSA